jgi:hypothetical protein
MRFAGRFIDLLGHQMYGGAVPAVAEFIANSWDADATKVELSFPDDPKALDSKIIVRDYGIGMSFDDLNNFYLNIGYERRKIRGERTASGRLVMGRKGIGKLAGFGISDIVTLHSVKDGKLVEFSMDYSALKTMEEVDKFEILPDKDESSSEPNGVTVILSKLSLEKRINLDQFMRSMARRFALNTDEMLIEINGKSLQKEDIELDLRVPAENGNWQEEEIDGFGKIRFWFGFTKNTIQDPELRGASVFARGRLAQNTPFFFNLTGGISGQVGLEYLTGQIEANPLDDSFDCIATDRRAVNWQFGKAVALEAWGRDKIRELCKQWKKLREDKNVQTFKNKYSEYFSRIDLLPDQEKKDVTLALDKISRLERIEESDFKIIASSVISGIERESVKKIIRRINVTSPSALEELMAAVKEWDVISAVSTAELVVGRIEIIKKFDTYIKERLREKAGRGQLDMQTFLKEHAWLLGHEYEQLHPADFYHEHGIDKWIEDALIDADRNYSPVKQDQRRFDLLVIKNESQIVVLELMRPGEPADYDHVMRLNLYVTKIQTAINSAGTSSKFRNKWVSGILIADEIISDPTVSKTISDLRGNFEAVSWNGLLQSVQARYKEFFDVVKLRAPEDPRIAGLVNLEQEN